MTELLADPKVTDALAALVVAVLVAMTGVVALVASQVRRWLEAKFAHVLEGVEEARAAALSADAQVSNDHDTNMQDDLDRAIATVHAVSDQIGELTGHVGTLADQLGRVETRSAITGRVSKPSKAASVGSTSAEAAWPKRSTTSASHVRRLSGPSTSTRTTRTRGYTSASTNSKRG